MAYLLGFDVGSTSIKASLLDAEKGACVASATSPPNTEMEIMAHEPGWAEQHPDTWWQHCVAAMAEIRLNSGVDLKDVVAIGLSYQMHGLVLVDGRNEPLRPAIIWCDSRAVSIGNKAFAAIGKTKCLKNLLNSPGNFTASKLKWVKDNEPAVFRKAKKFMLPGDDIALKLTGKITTTASGLSEAILWNFQKDACADFVLSHYGIPQDIVPEIVPTFGVQGTLRREAAEELGLKAGIPIAYRAGDQPNNALSLNVLHPGEIAATAGTSAVVYGVSQKPGYDALSRVNTFIHVNHTPKNPRYGTLLCVNGAGILYSWLKHAMTSAGESPLSYGEMDALAQSVPMGSDGLCVFPYGNGAERTLLNENIGAAVFGLEFNTHSPAHLFRAAQEGIVFALNYGLEIMKGMGIKISTVRAGQANMFLSPVFCQTFATLSGARLELFNTDGSQGAARGAGIGAGVYADFKHAFAPLSAVRIVEAEPKQALACKKAYARWKELLLKILKMRSISSVLPT
jgi:xylulokinase